MLYLGLNRFVIICIVAICFNIIFRRTYVALRLGQGRDSGVLVSAW
jgi:hypothetical protein